MNVRLIRADGSFVRRVSDGVRLRLISLGLVRPVGKRKVHALVLTVGAYEIDGMLAGTLPAPPQNTASHTTTCERVVGNRVYSHDGIRCAAYESRARI